MVFNMLDLAKSNKYRYGIFVGRFQPMHCMHVDCIQTLCAANVIPIILVGYNSCESLFYDPLRNPLDKLQLKYQISCNIDKLASKYHVFFIPDQRTTLQWLEKIVLVLQDNGISSTEALFYFRVKEADLTSNSPIKALSAYIDQISSYFKVCVAENIRRNDSLINATDIRASTVTDLSNMSDIVVHRNKIIEWIFFSRNQDPEKCLLESIPLSMLDIALYRMRSELGIRTETLVSNCEQSITSPIERIKTSAYKVLIKYIQRRKHNRRTECS